MPLIFGMIRIIVPFFTIQVFEILQTLSKETRLSSLRMFTLEMRRVYSDLCSLYATFIGSVTFRDRMIVIRDNQCNNRRKLMFYPPVRKTDFNRFVHQTFKSKLVNQEIVYLRKKKSLRSSKRNCLLIRLIVFYRVECNYVILSLVYKPFIDR